MKNAMQLKAIMKKLAKENQISAQLVLQNYMLERFLERVSLSPYRDNYIIKGGFLISSMVGLNSRATMDMDATIKGYPVTQDAVQKMIEQICCLHFPPWNVPSRRWTTAHGWRYCTSFSAFPKRVVLTSTLIIAPNWGRTSAILSPRTASAFAKSILKSRIFMPSA